MKRVGMARATGLEPAASGVTGRRSNQLSYARNSFPEAGIGPGVVSQSGWDTWSPRPSQGSVLGNFVLGFCDARGLAVLQLNGDVTEAETAAQQVFHSCPQGHRI